MTEPEWTDHQISSKSKESLTSCSFFFWARVVLKNECCPSIAHSLTNRFWVSQVVNCVSPRWPMMILSTRPKLNATLSSTRSSTLPTRSNIWGGRGYSSLTKMAFLWWQRHKSPASHWLVEHYIQSTKWLGHKISNISHILATTGFY